MRHSRPLFDRLGVSLPDSLPPRLDAALADAEKLAASVLGFPPEQLAGQLALPHAFREVLLTTCAEALASGHDEHAHQLIEHYAKSLPFGALLQQHSGAPPLDWLFDGPLEWSAMTRFRAGLEALGCALSEAEIAPEVIPGGLLPTHPSDWPGRLGTLYEHTYFGRCFPMFAAHANNLSALELEIARTGTADRWRLVDYRLGGALLHEILHFGRERTALFPPYLDEALAGYLGTRFLRETSFSQPGDDNALDGFPWFAQVGQALVRAYGLAPVLAAQAGERSWSEVLGEALLETLERLGWEAYLEKRPLHFHPDTRRPDRWAKLVYLARGGRDPRELHLEGLDAVSLSACELRAETAAEHGLEAEILEHALAAMCLETVAVDVTPPGPSTPPLTVWRVRSVAPRAPVVLDFHAGVCRTQAPAQGALAPLYVLPPGLCVEAVGAGVATLSVTLETAAVPALAELATDVLAGRFDRGEVARA